MRYIVIQSLLFAECFESHRSARYVNIDKASAFYAVHSLGLHLVELVDLLGHLGDGVVVAATEAGQRRLVLDVLWTAAWGQGQMGRWAHMRSQMRHLPEWPGRHTAVAQAAETLAQAEEAWIVEFLVC